MKINVDLRNFSREFINEVAMKTTSPEILDQITQFAIDVDNYVDPANVFEYDNSSYIDSVIGNQNVSEDTLIKIIRFLKSEDIQLRLIEERKLLNANLIALFINEVSYIGPIEIFVKKYYVSEELANVLVNRLINGEIDMRTCRTRYEIETIESAVRAVCERCSRENFAILETWWKVKKTQMFQQETAYGDILAERIMQDDLNAMLPKRTMFLDNAIRNLILCCSDEVGKRLTLWWENQKNKLR